MDHQPSPPDYLAATLAKDNTLQLIEIEGASGSGKTTLINELITHLTSGKPEKPSAPSVVLFVGDSKIDAARKRWAHTPHVLVQGRLPDEQAEEFARYDARYDVWFADISKDYPDTSPEGDGGLTVIFNEWFTERDGTHLLYGDSDSFKGDPYARERTWATNTIPFLRRANVRVIAAFRPGHTSHLTTEGEDGEKRADNEFEWTLHGRYPADAFLVPVEDKAHVWKRVPVCTSFPGSAFYMNVPKPSPVPQHAPAPVRFR